MSLIKARQLRESRAKLVKQAQELMSSAGAISAEQRTQFDAMMNDADDLKAQIDRLERLESAQEEIRSAPPAGAIAPGGENVEDRHKLALRSYLINGIGGMPQELRNVLMGYESRDMGTGGGNALQGTGGGYLVPVGMENNIEKAMKFYGSMLQTSTMLTTSTGQPLPYPTSNDTTVSGEQVDEAAPVNTGDITLGNIVLNAYQFSTKMVKVSRQLLQDSAFDFEAFVTDRFAERLGRVINTKTTTGSGTNTIKGLVTSAVSSGITAAGSSANSGGAETGATSVGSDDLMDLEHSVDVLYRPGAKYMMHDTTLKAIKKVKDKYGRPLWMPGLATREPDTINGYQYALNNDMAPIATTVKSILFGRLDKYMIRKVKELTILRLEERYAEYGQVAFIGFARYDGNLLDAGTNPVKYLTQA